MRPLAESELRHAWYAQPVVWLGIAIFVASIAGCIWMIVLSLRYDDAAVTAGPRVFGVPVQQPAQAPPR